MSRDFVNKQTLLGCFGLLGVFSLCQSKLSELLYDRIRSSLSRLISPLSVAAEIGLISDSDSHGGGSELGPMHG